MCGETTLARCRARLLRWGVVAGLVALAAPLQAQTLINVDFGVGTASLKTGMAAAGMGTNDYWNLYRHYQPKFTPGMALVADGKLDKLKLADGTESGVSVAVNNAPGVWGNSSGDPMYDTYIFAQNGSNITVTVSGLAPGRYHFYCYGHADPDVTGEQNSVFTLKAGHEHVRADHANGWRRLEGGQSLAGAGAVCRVPRRAGGWQPGRARRGAGAEWRGGPERPADHLARDQPAPPARGRAAASRAGQHEPPVPRNPL